ncbi:co-chaperone YbbN [Micrococcus sp.]|uniref:co-chaperone YbbN n=1 Tax=Micrococcus sp. TaxID=1271 RepID=UPI0026DD386D|nr:co-chaperone YbbN [Micrococcus sp.]MDO4240553.1 co-chaperone YbbN [Micrococcus sp.]
MTSQPSDASPAHLRGAVDLSSLRTSRPGASGPAAPGPGAPAGGPGSAPAEAEAGSWVVMDADQRLLEQLVQLSTQVPVVLALHVPGDPTSEALVSQFADAVDAQAGRLVMARLDVAAEPQLLGAFGLGAGPAVVAVVAGQPVPLVNQEVPAEVLERLMGELLEVARQNGVTGQVPPVAPARAGGADAAPAAPAVPARHRPAHDALAAGDLPGAVDAWQAALDESPADEVARQGLAAARLMLRTQDADAAAVRAAAAEAPDDVAAQTAVADLDVLGGHVEDAFARLVRFVAAHPGEDRDAARAHLVELYTVVGGDDPRVQASRRKLAAALF